MVRSRQLFLRSRLELAAELDYTALSLTALGKWLMQGRFRGRFIQLGLSRQFNRPVRQMPTWRQYPTAIIKPTANSTILWLLLALCLQCACVLPLAVAYGMAYYLTKITSNTAAADRLLPQNFLLTSSLAAPEDGDEDDAGGGWEGRVLDVEKRTKASIKKVQGGLEEKIDVNMKRMETKMNGIETKIDGKLAEILSLLNAPRAGVSTTDAQSVAADEADVDLDIGSNVSRRLSSAMS
jgi:hypothetical protein